MVRTNSSKQEIESFGQNRYLARLKSSPEDNLANIELIKMLSKFFVIPVSHIKIKHGFKDKTKLIEVN
ncbi:DUF167 domain-containing protein [Candidatus Pacearchaeota archaeon]|nr:DUF167 domain-containing protein [Candidatus Pacearchaeota archaeon]